MYITILYNFFYIYSVNKQKIEIPSIKLTFIIIKKKPRRKSAQKEHISTGLKKILYFFLFGNLY